MHARVHDADLVDDPRVQGGRSERVHGLVSIRDRLRLRSRMRSIHDRPRELQRRAELAIAEMYISKVKRYSVAQARANLPAILDAVESGSDVELTRCGRAVAVIIARSKYRSDSERPTFAEAYGAWRARHPNGVDLPDDYFEKLRDRSPGRKVRL